MHSETVSQEHPCMVMVMVNSTQQMYPSHGQTGGGEWERAVASMLTESGHVMGSCGTGRTLRESRPGQPFGHA